MSCAGSAASGSPARWLEAFHRGDRDVLEACYRAHFGAVDQAVARVLRGADKETVVQEVFLQVVSNGGLRRGFGGGDLPAWLTTMARSRAIDFWRRYRRERPLGEGPSGEGALRAARDGEWEVPAIIERSVEVRLFAARLRATLPPKWADVFDTRFLAGLDQRAAAAHLGISRTTLAYREVQVRRLLRRFARGRGQR